MALPLSTPPEIVFGLGCGAAGAVGGGGRSTLAEPGPLCEAGGALPISLRGAELVSLSFRAGLGDALVSELVPEDREFALSFVFARRPRRLQSERAKIRIRSARKAFISV